MVVRKPPITDMTCSSGFMSMPMLIET